MLQSYWDQGHILLHDVEPGPLKPGWVRLKVAGCGICGSDLHRYRRANGISPGQGTPGHELVGTVMQSESPLADLLYAVEPWVSCRQCDYCLSGQRQFCRSGYLVGVQIAGGLSEFVDVPLESLHPIDPSVATLQASLSEPTAVCTRAIHHAQLQLDNRVLILGGGTLGLLFGLLARDSSAKVAVTTRYPHQAEAAKRMGLQPLTESEVDGWAADNEPDVVIETVGGEADTVNQAMQAARPGGRIVVVGLFSKPLEIDGRALVMKELRLIGSKVMGVGDHESEFRTATNLLPRYREEYKALQTHQFPLDRIGDAFAAAADKTSQSIKVTVLAGA